MRREKKCRRPARTVGDWRWSSNERAELSEMPRSADGPPHTTATVSTPGRLVSTPPPAACAAGPGCGDGGAAEEAMHAAAGLLPPLYALERSMAKHAGSDTTEVAASHAVYASKPAEVARLIERAARAGTAVAGAAAK